MRRLLDLLMIAAIGWGIMRMITNAKHIEHTRFLIERLRLIYQSELPIMPGGKPLTIEQLERLLRNIAHEGYGL